MVAAYPMAQPAQVPARVPTPIRPDIQMPPPEEPVGPTEQEWAIVGGKPPRPDERFVLDEAKAEMNVHQLRVELAQDYDRWLRHKRFGYFNRDRQAIIDGEVEPYYDNMLAMEEQAAISFIASMKIAFAAKFRVMADREESAAKEDALHYWLECWADDHSQDDANGALRFDIPRSLARAGMVAVSMLVDPENLDTGVRTRLVDPLSVFPVYEGSRGIARLYRCYAATAGKVIGDFDTSKREVEKELATVVATTRGTSDRNGLDLTEMGDVTEYWDRRWAQVFWNEHLIYEWEHKYAHVPWIVVHGGFGKSAFMSSTPQPLGLEEQGMVWHPTNESQRETELVEQYRPFFWDRVTVQAQREKVGSQFMTLLRNAKDPAMVHYQTPMGAAQQGDVEIDRDEGGRTRVTAGDEIKNLEPAMVPEIVQPLLAFLDMTNQMSGMPALMMGNAPGSQMSGSAIDILSNSGARVWTPLVYGTETVYRACAERYLRLLGDFGPLLNDGEGALLTPRRNPNPETGESPPHVVTARMIRKTGYRTTVTLHQFNLANLGPTAAALEIAMRAGLTDRREAIRHLNMTDDVEGTIYRQRHDLIDLIPEVQNADALEELTKEAQMEFARGDLPGARRKVTRAHFIGAMMDYNQMVRMPGSTNAMGDPLLGAEAAGVDPRNVKASAGGDAPIPGTPVMPDAQTGRAGMPAVQGNSTPQFGRPTGTAGGRPVEAEG